MPTNEQFHEADQEHAVAIADLQRRVSEHDETLARHDQHIKRLDDFMVELRESLATKDDIQALRSDLRDRMDRSELFDERLDHYRQRIVDLEAEHIAESHASESEFARNMNWAVVGLFAIEVVVGALQLWIMTHHV